MSKKSTLILLSILHICILGICILTIYVNKNRTSEAMIARVSSDTKVMDSQTEPAVETNPVVNTEPSAEVEPEPEPVTEPDKENIPEPETIPEPEPEITPEPDAEPELSPVYSFHYIGQRANLNIRSAPSLDDTIIGKVPCGGDGNVLELTNDEWALIEYQGIIGYCNRNFLELTEIENKQE